MPFFGKWEILEPFLRGAYEHPNEALFQKGSRIFNMFLSYDGSLLYHLAAHMPLYCIIILALPSCPFVSLACRCLLYRLFCLHLRCTSLFWLIVVFTPLSCLLPPPSPKRAFVIVRPVANSSCPPPHSSCLPSRPFVVPAGCCITHFLCCWRLCHCCAHANALVALASLPSLRWHLSHCRRRQLFSAVHFRHRTLSCDRQRSCCRPLSPPIIVHRGHRRRCRCRRAATTATTTANTIVELTVVHCQRKRQQQHHHLRTNGSTNLKTFTNPVDLDLFKLIYSI